MFKLIFVGFVAGFFALAMQVEIAGPAYHVGNVNANVQIGGR